MKASVPLLGLPLEPEGEGLQRQEHLPDLILGLWIDQVAVGVELFRRQVCFGEDLRLVNEVDVKKHPDLPDVVLRPAAAGAARRAQHRRGSVGPAVGRP